MLMRRSQLLNDNNTLPFKYQQVEYLQSSGTQYIDTGIIQTATTTFSVDIARVSVTSTQQRIFGTIGTAQATDIILQQTKVLFRFGGNSSTFTNTDLNFHNYYCDGTNMYADDTVIGTAGSSFIANTIYMFNENSTTADQHICKIKHCILYVDGTKVRDFVPCYRVSDSVAGMYDIINKIFYTNSGTGVFIIGPEI